MTLVQTLFDPVGRNNRAKYWFAILLAYLSVFPTLSISLHDTNSPAAFLAYVGILVAIALILTASVRRLHDRGKDGPIWLGVFYLVPVALFWTASTTSGLGVLGTVVSSIFIVGAMVMLAWMFFELGFVRGTVGENEYGPDPLSR
jgi:uncharacterized membrane protein YhaH (DUF805 family)